MTADDFPRTWRGRLIETAKVLGAISIIVGTLGGAWAFTYGPVRDFLEQWEKLQFNQANLMIAVSALKGEDRIIREVPGLTYVSEPVYEGEPIVFNFVAERTGLGSPCILEHSQSMFTDAMNIPTPGSRRMAQRQIGPSPTPLRPEYQPPFNLRPGRVVVYLILTYTCDGKTRFDTTTHAAYELLAGPRPKGESQ